MTDEEAIKKAEEEWQNQFPDDLLVQQPGPEYSSETIVDHVGDGAWVMAWVWVAEKEKV